MRAAALLLLLHSVVCIPPAQAQVQVRGNALSLGRYVELRPVHPDTVPFDSVEALGDGTYRFEGRPIRCVPDIRCIRYLSGERTSAVVLTQDLGMTAWGMGVEGLSATVQLRLRGSVGGDLDWPRSADAFDALLAYAELVRGNVRVRAGRLLSTSGLGFGSYDGAHLLYSPVDRVRVQLFGGRSLARAVYEPRHEALAGVEPFLAERNALLFGGEAELDAWTRTSVAVRYQREIWTDRSALVSERASVDVQSDAFAAMRVSAGADYDFAFGRMGKANLNVRVPVDGRGSMLEAALSRYVPYFELWTIWGYFSPVAYHEAELRGSWRALPVLGVEAAVGYRRYGDANAPVVFDPLPRDAVSVTLAASWTPSAGVGVHSSYRLERGFGAYLGSGDAGLRLDLHERVRLTLDASAFQQIEEFRLGSGVVLGGGGSLEYDVTPRATLSVGGHLYRQTWQGRPGEASWNQRRGWAGLRMTFGDDPGMRGRGTP